MKYIFILTISLLYLQAGTVQNFKTFLNQAIDSTPYLHSLALNIESAKEEGIILNRYKNPSLELEVSQFSPDIGSNEAGFRAAYTQPIRLWGVADAKSALSTALSQNAKSSYAQKEALFVKRLSLLYVDYVQSKRSLLLVSQTKTIAKKIYDISLARYESGTIAKGVMLQAKIDYEMVEAQEDASFLQTNNAYFQLLEYAGVTKEIELDLNYQFSRNKKEGINPDIELLKAKHTQAKAELKVNTNKVEWVNLYAELEKEPDQNIARVGVNIPLAIFNTKTEEKQLSIVKSKRAKLLIKNEQNRVKIALSRLTKEREAFLKMQIKYEKLLQSETELLIMFQEGYKIASINLLQLQDIKNRVIQSRKMLINITSALDKNAILTNYIQGNNNE